MILDQLNCFISAQFAGWTFVEIFQFPLSSTLHRITDISQNQPPYSSIPSPLDFCVSQFCTFIKFVSKSEVFLCTFILSSTLTKVRHKFYRYSLCKLLIPNIAYFVNITSPEMISSCAMLITMCFS